MKLQHLLTLKCLNVVEAAPKDPRKMGVVCFGESNEPHLNKKIMSLTYFTEGAKETINTDTSESIDHVFTNAAVNAGYNLTLVDICRVIQ